MGKPIPIILSLLWSFAHPVLGLYQSYDPTTTDPEYAVSGVGDPTSTDETFTSNGISTGAKAAIGAVVGVTSVYIWHRGKKRPEQKTKEKGDEESTGGA
ncbi:unnamed protein product [Parascedosporium putredinis]|uniref:Uncharacterized protein n=1 Tax=Parascedosporium putredinis TaxID=1442378 RepID=A0A9P1HAM6_9PEZI|nr:unnamed protein product [Parascedosporium putredinis]CAI8001963.1 unnamed protein product [Parascedosporium putredinis]